MASTARNLQKLFVSNLPFTVGHRELRKYFQQFGRVVSANVVFDKKTGLSKGYAFVVLSNKSALEALENKQKTRAGTQYHLFPKFKLIRHIVVKMSDLGVDDSEENFNLAANYIQNNHSKFNKEDLLKFYAYYKQATVGKCNTSRPGMFNFQEKAKWDVWHALGDMTQNEAQTNYVDHLSKIVPDWDDNKEIKKSSSAFGASVSRPKKEEFDEVTGSSLEDFVKEGNLEKVKKCLEIIEDSELNSLDDEGLGPLHWAADRGNVEILETLLQHKNINVDLQDSEGQTALFYASSCGHTDCIQILLAHNANKEILDNENMSCLDVAFDDNVKQLLI